MRYLSKNEIDFDKLQENIKKTGFTDKTRRYIAHALLAAQVMGAMPNLAHDNKVNTYDI